MNPATLSGIREILELDFDLSAHSNLKPEDSFKEILDWSSMNALIIAARIKDVYGFDILPGELRSLETFEDLIAHINTKLATKK